MMQPDAAFLIKAYSFVNNVAKLYYCANNLKYYIRYRIRLLRDPYLHVMMRDPLTNNGLVTEPN
jgi:hypothetical protein